MKFVSGYLKCLSHLLFGDDVFSVWVDGNLRNINLSLLSLESSISVLQHRDRNTVQDEIDEVVKLNLEKKEIADQLRVFLKDQGFPDDKGLSATMLLARNHRDPKVRRANTIWWGIISRGVRRDQLSFDFAAWASSVEIEILDYDYRHRNNLFDRIKHKNTARRKVSDVPRKDESFQPNLKMPKLPSEYPSLVEYFNETMFLDESNIHRELNSIVANIAPDGKVEGNYCHYNKSKLHKYTPSDPRRSWKREYLRRSIRNSIKALEIGFNAGHSAAIMLSTQPGLVLHSIDISIHSYTDPCQLHLKSVYGDRFVFTSGDSKEVLLNTQLESYDFIHVDGGHDIDTVRSDLNYILRRASIGTLLMVDDAYASSIANPLEVAIKNGLITPLSPSLPSSGENQLYRIISNKDIQRLIPLAALNVLDVGCATGTVASAFFKKIKKFVKK